jgi:hypothetical protein
MTRANSVSPSAIKAARCRRRWWYKYALGLETQPGKAQQRGHDVEAQIVNYLKGYALDVTSEAGRIAMAALEYLPPPCSELFVFQDELTLTVVRDDVRAAWVNLGPDAAHVDGAITYHGKSDIRWVADRVCWLVDIKCVSELHWAMNAEEFDGDPQRTIYAAALAARYGLPVVQQWIYLETSAEKGRPHRAHVVERLDQPAELLEQMQALHAVGAELSVIDRETVNEEDMPRNLLACFEYNGCAYAEDCCADVPAWARMAGWVRQKLTREWRRKGNEWSDGK